MSQDYIAFISYRHCPLDIAVAERVQQQLERYRIPRDLRREGTGLGRVFRDREELPLTSDLTSDIYEALDHSRFLIVVCTPETPKSAWVGREIEYFIRRHGRERVLTVLADGTPEESLPPLLTHIYAEDGVTVLREVEPLAAYITVDHPVGDQTRAVLKNLKKEFLRLVAAILDCPYDALRQRQKRYRQRRVSCSLGGAVLIVLCFVGLLIHKNLQIQDQLLQSQQNESYALALVSQQRLEQGDRHGAIEAALSALPSETDNRPLSADAVQALTDALYAYSDGALRAAGQIEQDTDISALALSQDGGFAATVDAFACVRCFDTGTEALLWARQLSANASLLQISDAQQAVICVGAEAAVLLDLATGEPLRTIEYGLGDVSNWALSDDGTLLAILPSTLSDGDRSIRIYDTRTGLELCRTEALADSQLLQELRFSSDGSVLTAGFFAYTRPYTFSAFIIDTASGQLLDQYAFSSTLDEVLFGTMTISMLDGGGLQICTGEAVRDDPNQLVTVRQFSPGGALVFERSYSNDTAVSWEAPAALPYDRTMCYVFQDCVLGVSLETGEASFKTYLPADMLYCQMRSDQGQLLLALSDGSIRCLSVGDGTLADTASDGYCDCSFTLSAATGIQGEAPVLCVIPQDDLGRAVLLRSLGDDHAVTLDAPLESGVPQLLYGNGDIYPFPSGEGFLVFSSGNMDEDGSIPYFFTIYDAATLAQTDSFELDSEEVLALPTGFSADETKVYFQNCEVDLTAHTLDTLKWPDGTPVNYIYTGSTLSLSEQQPGQSQLTASYRYDPSELYWWCDGQINSTLIPYDVTREAPVDPPLVGGSGLIVLKHHAVQDGPVTGYALYSTTEDTWTYVDSRSAIEGDPVLCIGSSHQWAALADCDGILRVYDQTTDAVIRELPLPVDANTIHEMHFLMDDSILLIRTSDARVRIIDLDDGALLGCFFLENWNVYFHLTFQLEEQSGTLYLCDPYRTLTGLCIDTKTWTVTAAIPRLACYLPASHRVVNASGAGLQSYPVYTLEDLVEWGSAVLAGAMD